MSDISQIDIEQAKAALQEARAYHAGAMLAARHRPHDLRVRHRAENAVKQGQSAWQTFQRVAPAEMAAQIKAIMPPPFLE